MGIIKRMLSSDKITSNSYRYKGKKCINQIIKSARYLKKDRREYLDQIIFEGIGGNN